MTINHERFEKNVRALVCQMMDSQPHYKDGDTLVAYAIELALKIEAQVEATYEQPHIRALEAWRGLP